MAPQSGLPGGVPEVVDVFDLPSYSPPSPRTGGCKGCWGSGRTAVHWGARGWLRQDNECLHPKFSPGRSHVYTDTPGSNKYKYRYTLTKSAQPRGMCAAFPVKKKFEFESLAKCCTHQYRPLSL